MKKVLFPILALLLALGLALPMATPVAAAAYTIDLESDTGTMTAGYITTDPGDPPDLDPTHYTWSSAVAVSSLPGSWYNASLISPAVWISTNASNSGNEGDPEDDQWRLYKEEFTIPPGAVNIAGSLEVTADNGVAVYLNGSYVGGTGDVYGAVPLPPYTVPDDLHFAVLSGPYTHLDTFVPQVGTNYLMFMVRNWGAEGLTDNPTGLLYTAEVEYDIASIDLTKSGPQCAHEGDIISYNYSVHNDGDVPLLAPIVTDSLLIAVSPVMDGHPFNIGDTNDDGVFDCCETWNFTASYLVPTPQVPDVENEAVAMAEYDGYLVSDTANWSVDIQHPEIEVTKSGPADAYFQSVAATYSYTVSNTGDCDLYDVSLVDDNGTPSDTTDDVMIVLHGLDDLDGDLEEDDLAEGNTAIGSTQRTLTCECETITCFTNKATAEGTDAQAMTVTDTACWTVLVFQWQPRTIGYWGN